MKQEIGNSIPTWAEMTSKYFGQLGQLQNSFLARTPGADLGDTDLCLTIFHQQRCMSCSGELARDRNQFLTKLNRTLQQHLMASVTPYRHSDKYNANNTSAADSISNYTDTELRSWYTCSHH